jgi:hypothetical protein
MRNVLKLFVVVVLCSAGVSAGPDAPDKSFYKFDGQMYGEANQGQPAHHSRQTVTVRIPPGTIIDASYGLGNIACCGGDENGNGNSTAVPTGLYIEVGGGNAGEWGVFNIDRSSITDDDTGELKGYKLSADLYCGPSASHGGCNVHLYGWVKLRHR